MALIDWVIVVILVVSILSAAKKGFFLEVFSLAGVILGLLFASWNYQKLVPWFGRWIVNAAADQALSFIAIALGVMIAAGLIGRLIRWSVHSVGLGWADRLVGAAFGLVKGCALVTVAVLAVAAFLPQATWFRESRLIPYFLSAAHQASIVTPTEFGERIRQGVTILRNVQPSWIRPTA
ncbi:CvpA family protein [Silvibacterium sp.]|uniref:CvpA family protein n=1 Tax=Silvibacterium sp. TaxID=1964179 RepID=UPI0039E48585